jgi:hypothetical protein
MIQWDPLTLSELQSTLRGFPGLWWVAGGVAIELAVGSPVRSHGDIDILVLRRDQELLRAHLKEWIVRESDAGTSLWCRQTLRRPWSFEVLLDDAKGDRWVSRRCTAVTRPLAEMGWRTSIGIPVLAPEIVLFYKAKDTREHDNVDFEAVLPQLDSKARTWLNDAIGHIRPNHPWRRACSV